MLQVNRVHRGLREVLGTKVRQEIKALLVPLVKQVLLAQLVCKEIQALREPLGGQDQLALRVRQVTQEMPDWLDLWAQLGHQDWLDSQEHLALQAALVHKDLLVSKEEPDLLEKLASRAVQA